MARRLVLGGMISRDVIQFYDDGSIERMSPGFRTAGMAPSKTTGAEVGPNPSCKKCKGTGWFVCGREGYSQICNACCPHDQGYWPLIDHYGDDNGKWCCKRGCGHVLPVEP